MIGCVLAPVDGSPFGEHALPLAASIAKRAGAKLRLAHVHIPLITPSGVEAAAFRGPWNDITKEQERAYLTGLAARLRESHGIEAEPHLIDGPVAAALEEYARECRASLVVMSTHAHQRLSRLWHQGVAAQLARDLTVPVLLVRPGGEEEEEPDLSREATVRTILVPLDGSPYAEAMLEHAVALGRAFGARYSLLRVVHPETAIGYTLLGQDGHVNHHRLGQEQLSALQYLNAVAERLRAAGLEVHATVLASEDTARAIVEFAGSAAPPMGPADLIALETHPHRAMARVLGAHTADAVLHDSPVPVLLFDTGKPHPAPRERDSLPDPNP